MKIQIEVPDGKQTPRFFYAPWGDAEPRGSLGQEAIDLASLAGLELDPWQQWWMRQVCAIREGTSPNDYHFNPFTKRMEPKWAVLNALLIVSRQNGKGSLLEARELAGLFLFGEKLLIHSAHLFGTANEAFLRIADLINGCPELKKQLPANGILKTSGQQGITTLTGQRLLFKARSDKSIRGFTADLIVLDECMYLSSEHVGGMMPTLSSRPNPQIWMTGSAGDMEIGDCSHMGSLRDSALGGSNPSSLLFAEWSTEVCGDFCQPDCTQHDREDDPAAWAKANPAQGRRISPDYIQSEFEAMDRREFRRERLGIGTYPVDGEAWKIVPKVAWEARTNVFSELEGSFALAVDVTPDTNGGRKSCVAVSGPAKGDDSLEHVEITGRNNDQGVLTLDHLPGTSWVVPRVLEIWRNQKPECVIIDPATFAGGFIDELEQAGVKVIKILAREYAQACADFKSAVAPEPGQQPSLVHIGQAPLAAALAQADRRNLTEMWAWDKRSSDADISPLVAATLARWGYRKHVFTQKNLEFDFFFA